MIKQSISGQHGSFDAAAEIPEGNCFIITIGPFDEGPNIELELTRWIRNGFLDHKPLATCVQEGVGLRSFANGDMEILAKV